MTNKHEEGWKPGGLEAFVDAPLNDISDRDGAPDSDPETLKFGLGMVLALGKISKQYGDLTPDQVMERLKADHPDLAQQAGL